MAQREAARIAAVRHIRNGRLAWWWAQRVPDHMVVVRRMAVAAGITAGQAATAIELSTARLLRKMPGRNAIP
jgi:hypothetical protein